MKKSLLFCGVLLMFSLNINAQFVDNMEYPNGIPPTSTWWDCELPNSACPLIAGPGVGQSGLYSGYIPDDMTTEGLLNLGNKISGEWGLMFSMHIPSNREGYFNLQGFVPVSTGEWIVGNFFFNRDNLAPGYGTVDDTALGEVEFYFPHDQWFDVVINVDMSSGIQFATWECVVDGVQILPAGTPFTNENGDIPTSLGGVDFFSVSSNTEFYLDDFEYCDCFIDYGGPLSVADVDGMNFLVFPNPVQKTLQIETQERINDAKIYGIQGNILINSSSEKSIDVSSLSAGVYFVEVNTQKGRSTQKFIKQ